MLTIEGLKKILELSKGANTPPFYSGNEAKSTFTSDLTNGLNGTNGGTTLLFNPVVTSETLTLTLEGSGQLSFWYVNQSFNGAGSLTVTCNLPVTLHFYGAPTSTTSTTSTLSNIDIGIVTVVYGNGTDGQNNNN